MIRFVSSIVLSHCCLEGELLFFLEYSFGDCGVSYELYLHNHSPPPLCNDQELIAQLDNSNVAQVSLMCVINCCFCFIFVLFSIFCQIL